MTDRLIIGLHGEQGAGKDSVADYLAQEAGFTKIAFADALKAEIQAAWRLTPINVFMRREFKTKHTEQYSLKSCNDEAFVQWFLDTTGETMRDEMARPRSLRWVMQTWGTEYRRKQDDRYWVNKVADKIATSPSKSIVISDVRFENEARLLRATPHNGEIWRVVRPENPHTAVGAGHVSEKRLPTKLICREVHNISDLYFLRVNTQLTLDKLRSSTPCRNKQ